MFDTTDAVEQYLRNHLLHFVETCPDDDEDCNATVNELFEYKLELVADPALIQAAWDVCNELIDSDFDSPGDVVLWMRPIATHKLATQEIFNTYTRNLLLEWQLQEWDDWVSDPWDDMREVLESLTTNERFPKSGATVSDMVRQIHAGHMRFGICEGSPTECSDCQEIVAEFPA